ncbi:MAG: hypothetical protein PVF58_01375 [Candidatus Methanofastidiosia archaeon]|jgi:hypothetical protein
MDEKTKKILDELCQDKMNIKDAMKELDMSKEEIWELLDNYEYQTTMEETLEAFEILREVRESMKEKSPNASKKSRIDVSNTATYYTPPKNKSSVGTFHIEDTREVNIVHIEEKPRSESSATPEYSRSSDTFNQKSFLFWNPSLYFHVF